jgi:hypothetical protein
MRSMHGGRNAARGDIGRGWCHTWPRACRCTLVSLFAILVLSVCAASAQQRRPETIKSDGGRTLLYVYRPQTVVGILNLDVPFMHLDGKRLTRIRIGGHLAVPVSAGRHRLATTESLLGNDTGKTRGETAITVPGGLTVYLRYTESFKTMTPVVLPKGVFLESTGDYRFVAVPESEALAELAKTTPLELEK